MGLTELHITATFAVITRKWTQQSFNCNDLRGLRDVLSVKAMERSFEPATTINIQLMRDYSYINMNPSSSDEEIFLTQRHSKARIVVTIWIEKV